jgi:hypothetical protein
MPTVTLLPLTGSSAHFENGTSVFSLVGAGDAITAVSAENDGEYVNWAVSGGSSSSNFTVQFNKLNIPVGATIIGIVYNIVHRTSDAAFSYPDASVVYYDVQSANFNVDGLGAVALFDPPNNTGAPGDLGSTFETWTCTFPPTNPLTGLSWARNDFDSIWLGTDTASGNPGITYDIDFLSLTVTYTGGVINPCWYNPLTNQWQSAATKPTGPWFERGCPDIEFSLNPVFGSVNGGD